MKQNQVQQKEIRLGTHGENYGSWMSNPVFYVLGALLALSVVLAVLSFAPFWRCLWYWRCCHLQCSISRCLAWCL